MTRLLLLLCIVCCTFECTMVLCSTFNMQFARAVFATRADPTTSSTLTQVGTNFIVYNYSTYNDRPIHCSLVLLLLILFMSINNTNTIIIMCHKTC